MATVTTALLANDRSAGAPAVVVETASSLTGPVSWVAQPDVYVDRLVLRTNGVGEARLSYRYGRVRRIGQSSWSTNSPFDFEGAFVRITVLADGATGGTEWVGVVTEVSVDRPGSAGLGKQQVIAHGLEWFLGRNKIYDAAFRLDDLFTPMTVRVDRPAAFNDTPNGGTTAGQETRGNREAIGAGDGGEGPYGFYMRSSLGEPELWTGDQMVEHLLFHHSPRDSGGVLFAPIGFRIGTNASVLVGLSPTIPTKGRTVLELLNDIANPRRGVGWYAEYNANEGAPVVDLHFFSQFTGQVNLPGSGSVPANASQDVLDLGGDETVRSATVKAQRKRRYNRVRVIGARMTSTVTLGVGDGTLEEGWGSTEEEAYVRAGEAIAGFDPSKVTQGEPNDAVRKRADNGRVFRTFRINARWDGLSGDGSPDTTRAEAFPDLSENGSVLGATNVYPGGVRMLSRTRLQLGDNADSDRFDPPRLFFDVPAGESTEPRLGEDINAGAENAGFANYRLVRGDREGVEFQVVSTAGLQHTLALTNWPAAGESYTAAPTERDPEIDYSTLRLTVTLEADKFCEGVYDTSAPGEPIEELVIDAGPNYRLDFLAKNTITDIDFGQSPPVYVEEAAATVLRDDRVQLRDMARMASGYYRNDAGSLAVTWGRVVDVPGVLHLGQLITQAGEGGSLDTVDAVIGEIAIDIAGSTTSIRTVESGSAPPRSVMA